MKLNFDIITFMIIFVKKNTRKNPINKEIDKTWENI